MSTHHHNHDEQCHCHEHSHTHHHHEHTGCCCGGEITDGKLKASTKLILSAISLVVSMVISIFHIDFPFFPYSDPAWIAVYFCAGSIFESALRGLILQKKITVSLLVSVAMIASFALQIMGALGYNVGGHSHSYIFVVGEIAFLKGLAEYLEARTTAKTRNGIEKLSKLMPKTARVRRGSEIIEIPSSEIQKGDVVCVNPHEMISADGVIIKGTTSVNQSNMTGESLPIDVKVGDKVLCGTFNESAYIEVRALKAGNANILSKMIELVEEAEGKKAPIARIAAKWATFIVPTAIGIAIATFFFAHFCLNTSVVEAIVRATTILVVFCPCAFVLATPTAISAGIGNTSKNGILIKSGETLEAFSKISTMFFDKTGTLTEGKINVEKIENITDENALAFAAAIEEKSLHPLAKAIVEHAKKSAIAIPEAENITETAGHGIIGFVNGNKIEVKKAISQIGEASSVSEIFVNDKLSARIFFGDNIRASSSSAVSELKKLNVNVAILSGDNTATVEKIAKQCGIKTTYSNLLPQDKLEKIENAKNKNGLVCMVGDGVNDAPSLATADISVAIADLKNDIAISTAQVSLLDGNLNKIPALMRFSKKTINTIVANIVFSLVVSFTAVALGALGIINPAIGALIHNASSIIVVSNSARLLNAKTLSK